MRLSIGHRRSLRTKANSACTLPCTLPLRRLLVAKASSTPESRLSRSLAAVPAFTAACRACADPAFSSSCCDTILRKPQAVLPNHAPSSSTSTKDSRQD
jgi:hypothetical protein